MEKKKWTGCVYTYYILNDRQAFRGEWSQIIYLYLAQIKKVYLIKRIIYKRKEELLNIDDIIYWMVSSMYSMVGNKSVLVDVSHQLLKENCSKTGLQRVLAWSHLALLKHG